MAHSHAHNHGHQKDEQLTLGSGATKLFMAAAVVGLIGLAVAVGSSLMPALAPEGFRRFYFAYLAAFMFFLSLGIGGVFFLLVTYCTRSGWSIAVRRVPEALAKTLPLFVVLSLPILYTVVENKGQLFRWAQPPAEAHHAHDAAPGAAHSAAPSAAASATASATGESAAAPTHGTAAASAAPEAHGTAAAHGSAAEHGAKADANTVYVGKFGQAAPDPTKVNAYPIKNPVTLDETGKPEAPNEHVEHKRHSPFLLGTGGWIARVLAALMALAFVGWWYASNSKAQDTSGDEAISAKLAKYSPLGLIIFGFAVTFLAFDLIMSLDPIFYSTILGGYYFAGCAISVMASTILVCRVLQTQGYLKNSVTTEHFHDLGKFQFAFTFFWGYLAFSQFMLLWYSSQPEGLTWLARRGCSTAQMHLDTFGTWSVVSWVLCLGKLLIPFAGFLSRHVKRNAFGMIFWASWILVFQFVDMYWLIAPELDGKFRFGIPEIAAVLGIGGLFLAVFVRGLSSAALRPMKDPRLAESLAFHQSF